LQAGKIWALVYGTSEPMTIGDLMMVPMPLLLSTVSNKCSHQKNHRIEGAVEHAMNSGGTVVSLWLEAAGHCCNQWIAQLRWTGRVRGLWQIHPLVNLLSKVT
jgi:hypothetical protein